ncbi:hypothetical protein HY772_03395 [Candidatus Woesearchaeota archaeon]|nr:hypothetical protein [Candidatus Woesearchaeota archaeon]
MDFWVWLAIAFCFLVYVTVLFVKVLRRKESIGKSLKDWIVNIIDILSGGG